MAAVSRKRLDKGSIITSVTTGAYCRGKAQAMWVTPMRCTPVRVRTQPQGRPRDLHEAAPTRAKRGYFRGNRPTGRAKRPAKVALPALFSSQTGTTGVELAPDI